MLKMQASRYVFTEVNKRFATLPFSPRALDDEKEARMGVVEYVKHNLFRPYQVLYEKQGDVDAHFNYTVPQALLRSRACHSTWTSTRPPTRPQTPSRSSSRALPRPRRNNNKAEAGAAADGETVTANRRQNIHFIDNTILLPTGITTELEVESSCLGVLTYHTPSRARFGSFGAVLASSAVLLNAVKLFEAACVTACT